MIPQEIIRKKRDKHQLSFEEIQIFVNGLTDGSFSDQQIAGMSKTKLSHQETLEQAGLAEKKVINLLKNYIKDVNFDDTSRNN